MEAGSSQQSSRNRCLAPANQAVLGYYFLWGGGQASGGPWVGRPPGCSSALVASDAGSGKSRKQNALGAEGSWEAPRAGLLCSLRPSQRRGGRLPGLSGGESGGWFLPSQCCRTPLLHGSPSQEPDANADAHPRPTGAIGVLVGLWDPGVSMGLGQSRGPCISCFSLSSSLFPGAALPKLQGG